MSFYYFFFFLCGPFKKSIEFVTILFLFFYVLFFLATLALQDVPLLLLLLVMPVEVPAFCLEEHPEESETVPSSFLMI